MSPKRSENDAWRRLHLTHVLHSRWLLAPPCLAAGSIFLPVGGAPAIDVSFAALIFFLFFTIFLYLPVLVFLLIRHYAYRFQFHDDRLVVRKGLFEVNDTVVRYEMLHGLDTTRSPLHRLFGTVRINLQTRSLMFAEIDLRSVRSFVAEELSERLSDYQEQRSDSLASERDIEEPAQIHSDHITHLYSMSILECCKLGFVRNRTAMILAAIATFLVTRFSQLGSFLGDSMKFSLAVGPIDMTFLGGWIPWVEISISETVETWELTVFLAIVVCVFVMLLAIISLVLAIVQFYKFRLTLNDSVLRGESGLFIRAVQNTPLHRLQAIKIVSTLRSRLLGRESIWFGTSALPSFDAQQNLLAMLSNWLVPLVPSIKTREITRLVLPPNVDFERESWETINVSRVWKRRLNLHLVYVLALTLVFAFISLWLLTITAFLLGWAVLVSKLYAKSLKFQLLENAIMFRKGWWSRIWTIVPFDKIQAVKLTQNPFDRRFGMATLNVDVAAYLPLYIPKCMLRIPYIHVERCREIQNILIRESSRRENEW